MTAEIESTARRDVVSDDSEALILVDGEDRAIGSLDKARCHDGNGTLHRAFSVFIFNAAGELLLQQRASDKRLWPNFWSNSCCSHPRQGETMEIATVRRCQEELGITTQLQFIYKFEYQANFEDLGAEHELCSVYVGQFEGTTDINSAEVQAIRWVNAHQLDTELATQPEMYTPWFHMEWRALRTQFADHLPI